MVPLCFILGGITAFKVHDHRYMNDRVFGAMVSKSSSKSPNWIPSLNRTAISLNDGVFHTFMNDYQTTLDYVNDRSANVSA